VVFNTVKAICLLTILSASAQVNAYALGSTVPGKWGPAAFGTGAMVSYSFMATGVGCDTAPEEAGCSISALDEFMPIGYRAEIVKAFNAWSAVANIIFTEITDDGVPFNESTLSGDIRIGGHAFDGEGNTIAHTFFAPVNGLTASGDLHFDVAENWKIGFGGPGVDIFQVAAHEIGHAIGLAHTDVAGSLLEPFYTEDFVGPQADDIEGAIFIYGSAVVPLPGALWLFLSGIGALFMMQRPET